MIVDVVDGRTERTSLTLADGGAKVGNSGAPEDWEGGVFAGLNGKFKAVGTGDGEGERWVDNV